MEKLGNSIMHELEVAEEEVASAWMAYYNKAVEFSGSSGEEIKVRHAGARVGAPVDPNAVVQGCTDVWVDEMRYRMAVAFLSSIWEKCSSELSKLFLSMKDAECNRRNRIKELLIRFYNIRCSKFGVCVFVIISGGCISASPFSSRHHEAVDNISGGKK